MTAQKIKHNPRLFLQRAMEIQRRQLLLAMADAVSECRTAESMAAELNRDGETGLLRLAEIWCCLSPAPAAGFWRAGARSFWPMCWHRSMPA
ncbi:hypothetical protein C823_004648 [Eubacterium plexicaudatum ASF492]|nr:hypothetical protein C823_004648 [Eubacterium plexicaudatum ASF492]